MKFWGGLAVWIMGIAIALSVVSWVTEARLLQPKPLLQAIPSQTYSGLASSLPAALGKVVSLTPSDQSQVAQFVSPSVLQQLTNQVVTDELDYLHGQTLAVPTINYQPLLNQLDQGGATISPQLTSYLSQPQPITIKPVGGP